MRLTAIGNTIEELGLPDFICLQVRPLSDKLELLGVCVLQT